MTSTMEKNSKSRKRISFEEKLKILDRLKSGEKVMVIANDLKLSGSTIRTIKDNENKIRARISSGALVSLNKTARESASADTEAAERFRENFLKIVEDGNYTADQVYNADETSLYWKKMPGRTYISKNEKSASGFKVSKDRITILLCSNASGDNVTKPMLITRSLNPRAMKGVDKSTLPVFWRANKKAWVTGVLFRDWFYNCFVPEVEEYSKRKNISFKALLLVDNAPGHTDLNHPAVKLIFLPPNTTSILQPQDQGIIKSFKSLYIRHTFEHILQNIDCNPNTTTVPDLWKDFSILNSIEIISLSLKKLKCSTLNACWGKLWPEVVIREDRLTSVTTEVNRIINIAHTLGGEGFVDMNEEDVIELINTNQQLDEEELMQLAELSESSGEEDSLQIFCEPEQYFNLEILNKALELAKNLEELFTNNDPSTKRSEEFKKKFKDCLAPYFKLINIYFKHPSTCVIADSSQSGKTTLVKRMIHNEIYENPPKKILWCYSVYLPFFQEEKDITFMYGLPESVQGWDLIIIDDLMHELSPKTTFLFSTESHHYLLTDKMKNVKENYHMLALLAKTTSSQRKAILKEATPNQVKVLCEICDNLWRGNIPTDVRKLRKYKEIIM
ncbi:tigger transposable element-derived protein 1-like [Centruroides sculpturatus]|uniref:tigger transposable element-derived protein 1-like n=1 Tax=Centruroides sculpturatus TaxID=218467 RepID=UPI000C6E969F|nr:tigger transposable element-derived protein 1-like [Centruroides sculpturatus]